MTDLNGRVLTVQLPGPTRELLLRMTMGNVTLARLMAEQCVISGTHHLFHVASPLYCKEQAAGIVMAGHLAEKYYDCKREQFITDWLNTVREANEPPF